jgi:hypothetical protein
MDRSGSVILHLSLCVVGTEIIVHWLAITGHAKPIVKVIRNVTRLTSFSESAELGALIIGYI